MRLNRIQIAAILLSTTLGIGLGGCTADTENTRNGNRAEVNDLTPERLENAACIVQASRDLDMDSAAALIGVMTSLGESGLLVLDYGDEAGPDSRGLFQQRDNGAWGTLEDRMDPYRSATNFFQELMNVADWTALPPSQAAHRVQRNADPDHYTQFLPFAQVVLDRVVAEGITCEAARAS